ncbi:hypothetical protein B0H66DRAFT_532887 [Apodospora peruviana]|uniref:Ubiquitin-like protein smt3 n=1 Tax=Apodospora peruviana TaxID=516989 RepID=A0AAE0M3Z9_9PEZI|nr:hypothetical protein B0H66DRAFT_532887 [Apodospora peruviana]
MASQIEADIASKVSKLSLKTVGPGKTARAKKVPAVADSWEDEDLSSSDMELEHGAGGDDSETAPVEAGNGGTRAAGTRAPPPTPMSPTYGSRRPFSPTAGVTSLTIDESPDDAPSAGSSNPPSAAAETKPRPEKTDAVARRMIASALGMKVPKLTEEQRAYDRAVREKERRRKEEEKELQKKRDEEALKAKQAVWEE